jgi:cbb3-type cytochrome oxidase subunit 3
MFRTSDRGWALLYLVVVTVGVLAWAYVPA